MALLECVLNVHSECHQLLVIGNGTFSVRGNGTQPAELCIQIYRAKLLELASIDRRQMLI